MDRNFLLLQSNLKKTALGVRFGKKLLTDPKSISTKQITSLLKVMGANIPDGVEVAADAAQALMLGSAVMTKYQQGANISQLVKPSVSAIGTLSRIANEGGMIDNKSAAQLALVGDAALIFASGGTDVGAWVRVAMSIAQESGRADAEALGQAQFRAIERLSQRQKEESQKFLESVQSLQDGKLGMFSFLVENAKDAPLMYDQAITRNPAFRPLVEKFPGLNFLPRQFYNFAGEGGSVTFWGEQKTKHYNLTVTGLLEMSQAQAVEALLNAMAGPVLQEYLRARSYYLQNFKADIFDVAVLALFEPKFYISPQSDVYGSLIKYRLTPNDIGADGIFNSAIVTSNNRAVISNFGLVSQEKPIGVEKMRELDQSGDMTSLLRSKEAREIVQRKFAFSELPFENSFQGYKWRDFSNLIALLDFMEMIYLDPKYEEYRQMSGALQAASVMPRILDLRNKYDECFTKSMLRRVNETSKMNASYFLNTPPKKLNYVVNEAGGPTIFR